MPRTVPFLRRPDLLKSLLGFWHNHPSLSYLFSGLFIGPTSQHPRIDEARQDSLNELEIAFAQISPLRQTPPWMTDRLFRNLLADMTGNTHRTEFCIDKMYAPEGGTGRRGLVEFRGFEMPPHARMSAAQMLLMRAAVAAFWQSPYERRLVRWGTRLNDEFMLPHYCAQDFQDVLRRSARAGLRARSGLVRAASGVPLSDRSVRSRCARPSWKSATRWNPGTCWARNRRPAPRRAMSIPQRNGCRRGSAAGTTSATCWPATASRVPLTPTERAGEFVAGVRFKAWQPSSALHPTIAAQAPLVFDIYDRWSGRSLGGLTHHVAHPGGPQLRAPSRSTPTRPRRAAARGSSPSDTRRARCRSRDCRSARNTRARWICDGLRNDVRRPTTIPRRRPPAAPRYPV